jgi:uncharacterized protein
VKRLVPFAAGLLFALGLGVAGMTVPAKIIAFLDVFGRFGPWDASMGFVMAGALLVYAPAYRWLRARRGPAAGPAFAPPGRHIDGALVGGAAVFGVGWGLSGLCPGPAFVTLAGARPEVLLFVACMFAGTALARRFTGT